MGRLARVVRDCRAADRSAFIAYVTAGDPSLDGTARFVRVLAAAGADVIELGVPFSDPVADGPTNQRAAERALAAGTTTAGILEMVRRLRDDGVTTPLVLFTYANPVVRQGWHDFTARARNAGVDGMLVLDVPPEEAGDLRSAAAAADLDTVFLASPTTAPDRLRLVDEATTGFVYYVSRLGVTGRREGLPDGITEALAAVRRACTHPVVVGFGIATADHVRLLAPHTDGVVVGSAIVDIIARHDVAEAAARIGDLVSGLVEATCVPPKERAPC